jgi:hypothetical protein
MKKPLIIFLISLTGHLNFMKTFLVLCFMLITMIGKAQDKYIGESYSDINNEMFSLHNANTNVSETAIATQYQATFKVGEGVGFAYMFLFNKADNVCTGVKEIMTRDAYTVTTNNLNKQYTKVDDTHWISKDNIYRIILDASGNNVIVTHLKIK